MSLDVSTNVDTILAGVGRGNGRWGKNCNLTPISYDPNFRAEKAERSEGPCGIPALLYAPRSAAPGG